MADNVTTQSATPATLPDATIVAAVEASFSGDTVQAGVGVLAKSAGAEGSRTLTLVDPATEGKQDTGNTSLASLDTKAPALGQALAAASTPVVLTAAQVTTLTPPAAITGFATAAKQDTGNTSLATLAGAVGGSEMQVDVVTLPTVTVNAHAVTNAGTFVVQENGAALTALQLIDDAVFAEDVAAQAADKGLAILAVRRDADTTLVGADNDYANLQVDAAGKLKVEAFSGETLPVSLASVPSHAVTNAGTFAVQVDNTVTVGSHAVTNAGTFATQVDGAALTALQLIDDPVAVLGTATYTEATTKGTIVGAVRRDADTTLVDTTNEIAPLQVNAGGQLKVAVIAALPAGSAAIGKLSANSGVDIGDVDVTSLPALAAGSNNIGDVDVLTLPALVAGAALIGKVGIDQTTPGTTDSVTAKQGAAGTAWEQVGDIAHDAAGAAVNPVAVGGYASAAAPSDVSADADVVRAWHLRNGAQAAVLTAAGALIGGDATNGLDVDVTRLPALVAGTANIGDVDVLTVPTDPFGANADAGSTTGSISAKLKFIAATGIPVTGTVTVGSHAVTNAGTFAVQAASAGDIAHDGADSGNPVKVGARARSSEIAAVANNDRVDLLTDLVGKLITLPYANPENFVSGAITSAMTGTTSTSLIAAPAAGLRNYITQITVSNAHATVGTDVAIQDGSGGTTLYTIPAAAVYGGAVISFPCPLRQPTTATAIYCANVTTGASVKVSASGYKGA